MQLAAGESRTVHGTFPVAQLATTPGDIDGTARPTVQPGGYQVQVGSESAPLAIRGR